jgi:hypothetical protein
VQALQSLADNKRRRLRSIIICLHVIFITSVFTVGILSLANRLGLGAGICIGNILDTE